METKLISAIIALAALSLFAEAAPQPLIVDVPETWEVDYTKKKGMNLYLVRRKGEGAVLMFYRILVPKDVTYSVKHIPELIKGAADEFVERAKNSTEFAVEAPEYKIEQLDGEELSGSYVKFATDDGLIHVIFRIGDKQGTWSGQFSGKEERWAEALAIVKKLRAKPVNRMGDKLGRTGQ